MKQNFFFKSKILVKFPGQTEVLSANKRSYENEDLTHGVILNFR